MNLSEITASFLAIGTTVGYFWVMHRIIDGMPPTEGIARDLMNQLLGSLTTVWVTLMAYYFGGSKRGNQGPGGGDQQGPGGDSDGTTRSTVRMDRTVVAETTTKEGEK